MRSRALWGALLIIVGSAIAATAMAESVIDLSWHRPHGRPGAASFVSPSCGDSAREDTLFLTFKLEHPRPALTSVRGAILFSPQPGESLGTFWQLKTGWPNGGGIHIEFPPQWAPNGAAPWQEPGAAELDYDHRSGRGRLDFHYAAPPLLNSNGLDPGVQYMLARVRILHHRPGLTGCAQPICVEWSGATLIYATGRVEEITKGDRFVSWYGERACSSLRSTSQRRTWLPRSR